MILYVKDARLMELNQLLKKNETIHIVKLVDLLVMGLLAATCATNGSRFCCP